MSRPQTSTTPVAVLWASAFVIGALTLMQAGRLPSQSAYAETAANRSDFTLLTARSGRGDEQEPDEVLFVIDNRERVLLVYEVEDAQRGAIFARDGGSLDSLFRGARPR